MNEYQTDIEGLKKIIEEQNYRISSEIDSEMNKLRIYHELEKEKLEKRVSEEKEKANKKINVLKEEYERMMNEKEDEFYNQLQEKENQINLNNQFFKENISKI